MYEGGYFTITTSAIKRLPPKEVGKLFSVTRCYAVMLSLFVLQSPTPEETSSYCADLWGYVADRCPDALVQELDVVEYAIQMRCYPVCTALKPARKC
jgi:hypothetical protein